MFKNFFKTTIRSLERNKGYSFLNIFGLAIGIACAGFIFLWVEDELRQKERPAIFYPGKPKIRYLYGDIWFYACANGSGN
ncbi:MAG: hypothetical protein ACTHOB_01490 [Ginsengibacter sp.]